MKTIEFTCGKSTLTRSDLEDLPVPFCTDGVSDEIMQSIVDMVETETESRSDEYTTDDGYSEIWWEELEAAVIHHGLLYCEDME